MKAAKQLATVLYEILSGMNKKPNKILHNSKVERNLKLTLKSEERQMSIQDIQRNYVIEKWSLCILILTVGGILTLGMWIKEKNQTMIEDNIIYRNSYGEGSSDISLVADTENDSFKIELMLDEKKYSETELVEIYPAFMENLELKMLGKNASLDEVSYDLCLMASIADYPFLIEWQTDAEYISINGELVNDKLTEPIIVELTAYISYESFVRIEKFNCMVYGRAIEHELSERLENSLSKIEEQQRNEGYIVLPTEYDGISVSWKKASSHTAIILLILTITAAFAISIGKDNELQKSADMREEQMKMDYPEIVSKLSLLTGAGMTAQNAWNKVTADYQKRQKRNKKFKECERYAYEEMLLTVYELENGVSFFAAYEHFSKRCGVSSYTKLANLITQNITKGSSNLSAALREEASEAFRQRKHIARKKGEQAGTKLLIPMMMLLAMIMIMIMTPAFIQLV